MKKCTICDKEKNKDEFYFKSNGLLKSECKTCSSNYSKNHHAKNKEHRKKLSDNNKNKWIELFNVLCLNICQKCGYNKCFAAIDFHHRDPKKKEQGIGKMMGLLFNEENRKKMLGEIKKCDVLCANCHRELHYNE